MLPFENTEPMVCCAPQWFYGELAEPPKSCTATPPCLRSSGQDPRCSSTYCPCPLCFTAIHARANAERVITAHAALDGASPFWQVQSQSHG